MDFNIKKPLHILALLMIIASFFVIIILPILSFFEVFPSSGSVDTQEIQNLSSNTKLIFEIILLVVQLSFVIVLMVFFPILWYLMVNGCSFKEILSSMKLKLKGFNMAFLWGILAAVLMFALVFVFEIILIMLGVHSEELGNIQDIETYFSPVSILIILAVQPMAEEIFFRGFLFDKISSFGGGYIAIVLTAVLFGLAHMSYSKPYLVVSIIMMGVVLGCIVVKTKNLYSAIVAHTTFNVTSFILYILAKSLM